MKIDLHIHSRNGSDGKWHLPEIFAEASKRGIGIISITDHDSVSSQAEALSLSEKYRMHYIAGIELNVTFSDPRFTKGKAVSLDFLGYGFDPGDKRLVSKLETLRDYRKKRAGMILENLNEALSAEGKALLTESDMRLIEERAEGAIGRPHIAAWLVENGLAADRQEAFDRYLVKCDVPKMPLSLEEASSLIKGAGGRIFLAHPDDPNGTSLRTITSDLELQQRIIEGSMLGCLDGIECWHSRHSQKTIESYRVFAEKRCLLACGGSDCHQDPVIMGTLDIPPFVALQFGINIS